MKVNGLEEVRMRANISQQKFADILGLSLSTYRRLINGETTKYHDSLEIADRLYRETGLLLFQAFTDGFEKDDRLRTIDKVSRLSKPHMEMVEKYADLCNGESTYFRDADRILALQILEEMYHKIIKMDLKNDIYIPYRVDTQEWNSIKNKTGKISVWIKSFAGNGFVHPDDTEDFLAFLNTTNLKKLLRREEGFIRHKYRRNTGEGWSWCMMEIRRAPDYSPEHPVAMAYIRMVDEDYA